MCVLRRSWAMALSFLYLAFVRIVQLLQLLRCDSDELAIESSCSVTKWRCSGAR